MELLSGGDLFERITESEMTEDDSKNMFLQMVRSVNYLHKSGVVHRDLKPENFLFIEPHSIDLKMIDFGLATNFTKSKLTTKVGSPYFIAPETLNQK